MSEPQVFPAIIKATYDGSAGFPRMVQEARDVSSRVRRQFENDFTQIGRTIQSSLAKGLNSVGTVDINVGGYAEAAAQARAYRQTAEELRRTTERLARETGDTSAATHSYIAALSAQVTEARRAERAAEAELASHTRLQAALNRSAGEVQGLARSYRDLEVAKNRGSIAQANAEVRNRRFTEFDQARGVGPQVSNSAREAAIAFEAMFAAEDRAARAAADLQAEIARLRSSLDPTIAIQQRFNSSMDLAERAYEQGAIGAREYADMQQRLRAELQNSWAAMQTGSEAASRSAGTNRALAASAGAVRTATLQAGQQLQDVAISLYSGQRAGVVFAQQLPHLAFALSGLEGSANRTHARIGRFATFLSGPWGIAVGLGVAAVGTLVASLFDSEDATDKSGKAHETFREKLDRTKHSLDEVIAAVREYNNQAAQARESTLRNAEAAATAASKNIAEALSIREKLAARYEEINSGPALGDADAEASRQIYLGQLDAKIRENDKKLKDLATEARRAVFNVADEIAKINADPLAKVKEGFLALRIEAAASIKDVGKLAARLTEISKQQAAAEEAARKLGRATKEAGIRQTAAFGQPLAGNFPITGRFGEKRPGHRHAGIDFAAPTGTPVHATQVGVVEAVGYSPTLGKYVVIAHGAGTKTRYGHLSDNSIVSKGDAVTMGQRIGKVGSTGRSTGSHLHYETLVRGKAVNPATRNLPIDPVAVAEATQRADEQLQAFGERAAERIARITEQFDDQPRAIDRAMMATRELNDLLKELGARELLSPDVVEQIEKARSAVASFNTKPFRDMVQAAAEQAEITQLQIEGRSVEAEVLSRALDLLTQQSDVTGDQLRTIRDQVLNERLLSRELEKQNALRERSAQLVDDTYQNIRQTMQELARGGGVGSIGKAFKRQFDMVLGSMVDELTDGLFGDFFREAKDKALGTGVVKEANDRQAKSIDLVSDALTRLRGAIDNVAERLSDTGLEGSFDRQFAGRAIPANDNVASRAFDPNGEIVVEGVRSLAPREFLGSAIEKVADVFLDRKTAERIGKGFSDGLKGYGAAYGSIAGGLVLGSGGSQFGSAAGGALGEAAFKEFAGKGLQKALGSFGGPLASIAGGLLGGLLGGMLTSTPKASATIGGVNGSLQVVSTRGNSASRKRASEQGGNEAIDTLDRIAEALGATINAAAGSVSIGIRDKSYRVDTTGQGITKKSRGAIDFGQDSAAAIKAATLDLIRDGVLEGLRDSTQYLLKQAKDLEAAIQKAVDFEGIFSRLKGYKDPVGAAIDAVNKDFTRLRKIALEANATAEEIAQLEELYWIERKDAAKSATESLMGSIKQLVDDLQIGDSGLSLRARISNARAIYDPLAADVRAGKTVDYGDFTDAARTMLDISRQLYGSQQGYFDVFNDVLGLSKQALAGQQALIDGASGIRSPFDAPAPSADTVPVVAAINDQSQLLLEQLSAVNRSLTTLVGQAANNNALPPITPANGTYF